MSVSQYIDSFDRQYIRKRALTFLNSRVGESRAPAIWTSEWPFGPGPGYLRMKIWTSEHVPQRRRFLERRRFLDMWTAECQGPLVATVFPYVKRGRLFEWEKYGPENVF